MQRHLSVPVQQWHTDADAADSSGIELVRRLAETTAFGAVPEFAADADVAAFGMVLGKKKDVKDVL